LGRAQSASASRWKPGKPKRHMKERGREGVQTIGHGIDWTGPGAVGCFWPLPVMNIQNRIGCLPSFPRQHFFCQLNH